MRKLARGAAQKKGGAGSKEGRAGYGNRPGGAAGEATRRKSRDVGWEQAERGGRRIVAEVGGRNEGEEATQEGSCVAREGSRPREGGGGER